MDLENLVLCNGITRAQKKSAPPWQKLTDKRGAGKKEGETSDNTE